MFLGEAEANDGWEAAVANEVFNCNVQPQKHGKFESIFWAALKGETPQANL